MRQSTPNLIPVIRSIHENRFCWAFEFARAARGYWLAVFPRVHREIVRVRAHAACIPDARLRDLALLSLEHKRANIEGAAAFATLTSWPWRAHVVRSLVACQVLCDYLDVLCEQPSTDPIATGYELHEKLYAAFLPVLSGERARWRAHRADGRYLGSLVDSIRGGLSFLPARQIVARALARAADRIVTYQALNHGDACGSHEPFERWAKRQNRACEGFHWWETGGAAGSTLGLHVLMGVAADPDLSIADVEAIESAYFPWVGALHSLLDSLVDRGEDMAMGARGLIDCYASANDAAERMHLLLCEALRRTAELPRGRRHMLIVAAMTCFYLGDLRRSTSTHAQLIAPLLLQRLGPMAAPNMAALRLCRCLRAGRLAPPEAGTVVIGRGRAGRLSLVTSRKSSI